MIAAAFTTTEPSAFPVFLILGLLLADLAAGFTWGSRR